MSIIVIDIGGTGSRALFSESTSGKVKVVEGPGANPNRVGKERTSETLLKLIKDLGIESNGVDKLVIGLAGISCVDSFEAVRNGVARSGLVVDKDKAWLMSDAELAHIAAFGYGMQCSDGILLIAGTGSIAIGRPNPEEPSTASIIREGGLGFKDGDEGSGHWIGFKLKDLSESNAEIKKALLAQLSLGEEDIAGAEPSTLAVTLDPLSATFTDVQCIASEAGQQLAKLCLQLRLQNPGLCRIRAWGSVLKHSSTVRSAFKEGLVGSPLELLGDLEDAMLQSVPALQELTDFPSEGLFLA